ncbi:MAG: mercury methylation corrinoid protein HgcA, partial [Actinomycetota bacterium]|nr:mercury methylation corrinoid protein HgcA [Actinomycetota bacterium]
MSGCQTESCCSAQAPSCCAPSGPTAGSDSCCGGESAPAFDYGSAPWIVGEIPTFAGPVPTVSAELSRADVRSGWRVRWNVGRERYRVAPGLYAVGSPHDESPVLATANYKLTFDALRRELGGRDVWILVLDTFGINVWCAAGKGTFGTGELVGRIRAANLARVVGHGTLVVPQLGAPGIAAHEVRAATGFRVVYGPVRAADIPAFLDAGMKADERMRRVTFTARERLTVAPVELSMLWRPSSLLIVAAVLMLGGLGPWGYSLQAALARGGVLAASLVLGVVTGALLVPAVLPTLPGRMFSTRGAVAGALVAGVALSAATVLGAELALLTYAWVTLAVAALSSFVAMNFTGSSTFTSLSGVLVEMRRALPWQV